MIYFQVVAISIETVLVFAIGGVLIHAAFWPTSPVPSKIRQRLGDALIYVAVFIFIGSGVSIGASTSVLISTPLPLPR